LNFPLRVITFSKGQDFTPFSAQKKCDFFEKNARKICGGGKFFVTCSRESNLLTFKALKL